MASLLIKSANKHGSRSPSPSRAKTSQPRGLGSHASTPLTSKHISRQRIANAARQRRADQDSSSGNGSTSSRAGIAKRIRARHKSPNSEASFAIEGDDFLAAVHPPTDDENERPGTGKSMHSHGSSEVLCDDTDSSAARARRTIEKVQHKISTTKELIRLEQVNRDDNVNEYLRSATIAEKHHLPKIKQIFEKKNQKSAQNIAQLQKKLDGYEKTMANYELHGVQIPNHRQPREVLREMGHGLRTVGGNIRDGLMSKPRAFAHLMKNKFGSADNINMMANKSSTFYVSDPSRLSSRDDAARATLPSNSSLSSGLGHVAAAARAKFVSDEGSECSSVTSESGPRSRDATCFSPNRICSSGKSIFSELQENRQDMHQFREKLDNIDEIHKEFGLLSSAFKEDKTRFDKLEEKINSLSQLHYHEIGNLKRKLDDIEGVVQNQNDGKLNDIHRMLETCQTKICKMEHQHSEQPYVHLEVIENSNARDLLVKFINIGLTILQLLILLLATSAGIMMPFFRTSCTKPNCFMCRTRIAVVAVIFLTILIVMRQWPDIQTIGSLLVNRHKQSENP